MASVGRQPAHFQLGPEAGRDRHEAEPAGLGLRRGQLQAPGRELAGGVGRVLDLLPLHRQEFAESTASLERGDDERAELRACARLEGIELARFQSPTPWHLGRKGHDRFAATFEGRALGVPRLERPSEDVP